MGVAAGDRGPQGFHLRRPQVTPPPACQPPRGCGGEGGRSASCTDGDAATGGATVCGGVPVWLPTTTICSGVKTSAGREPVRAAEDAPAGVAGACRLAVGVDGVLPARRVAVWPPYGVVLRGAVAMKSSSLSALLESAPHSRRPGVSDCAVVRQVKRAYCSSLGRTCNQRCEIRSAVGRSLATLS
jgi:hypothetical protein